MNRATKRTVRLVGGVLLVCALGTVMTAAGAEPRAWPFFAFDNGVGRGTGMTPDQQAAILADLGYQGIGYTGAKNIPAMLKALEARGLKMFSTYIPVELDSASGKTPYDPDLPKAIRQLKGQGTALWIHIHGSRSPAGGLDDRAVRVIREIAGMAKVSGLPVVLYPHTGFYVATTRDALRIVKKVDRDNVGASLNLCHFLKQNDEKTLESVIKEALPHLMLVSINGADSGETRQMGWDRLIQTLDRGTFDVSHLLKLLNSGGYDGPIGLQCYAIKGDVRDNLKRSMEAWRTIVRGAGVPVRSP